MQIISKYLHTHLFSSLINFFIPLFGIASLIFFIKMVSLTSVIQLSFFELMQLYIFILPQILFFTLPVVFVAAAIAMLSRLSFEYELVALFSLGISPHKIIFILAKLAAVLSILLLFFSLILTPQAKQLYKGFIVYKRAQAKFNIKPSEFGHKFGDWYLFINGKKNEYYYDISLYNYHLQNQENFITAKKAQLSNEKGHLALTLFDGHAYTYKEKSLKEIAFEKMKIYDTGSQTLFSYTNPLAYWKIAAKSKKRAFDLTLFILFSLFPLATLYFLAAIGISNPRYEKRGVFLPTLLLVALYFGISFALAKSLTFVALAVIPIWLFTGYMLYKKLVAKRY